MQGQGQKGKQKHITKKFDRFHNHCLELTMLAYCNKEPVKNTESLEKIPKKELNERLANFWLNAKKKNGESYRKKSALMGIRFGLQ